MACRSSLCCFGCKYLEHYYYSTGNMYCKLKCHITLGFGDDMGCENYESKVQPPSGIILKDMTKKELKVKVSKQLSIIDDANNEICSYVNDYIESLPYKVGDKVRCLDVMFVGLQALFQDEIIEAILARLM